MARGSPVHILLFVANPQRSPQGQVEVNCDFLIRKPDGSSALRQAAGWWRWS